MNKLEKVLIDNSIRIDFLELDLKSVDATIEGEVKSSTIRYVSIKRKTRNGVLSLEFIIFDPSFSKTILDRTFEVKNYTRREEINSDGKLTSSYFFQTPIIAFNELHLIEFKLKKVLNSKSAVSLGQNFLEDRFTTASSELKLKININNN